MLPCMAQSSVIQKIVLPFVLLSIHVLHIKPQYWVAHLKPCTWKSGYNPPLEYMFSSDLCAIDHMCFRALEDS